MSHRNATPAPPQCFHYEEPITGRILTYEMGYATDGRIPCMAVWGAKDKAPAIVPVEIMVHAIELAAKKEKDAIGSESAYA